MPGLRYGPDITDDAASLMKEERSLRARLKTAQSPRTQQTVKNRLKAIDTVTSEIFGGRKNRNQLANYSLEKQGYAPRGSRGGGRQLRRTPTGKATMIPRKSGYKARPSIPEADRGAYRSATKKARPGQVADALKAAQKARKATTSKQRKASASKAVKAKAPAARGQRNRNR